MHNIYINKKDLLPTLQYNHYHSTNHFVQETKYLTKSFKEFFRVLLFSGLPIFKKTLARHYFQ